MMRAVVLGLLLSGTSLFAGMIDTFSVEDKPQDLWVNLVTNGSGKLKKGAGVSITGPSSFQKSVLITLTGASTLAGYSSPTLTEAWLDLSRIDAAGQNWVLLSGTGPRVIPQLISTPQTGGPLFTVAATDTGTSAQFHLSDFSSGAVNLFGSGFTAADLVGGLSISWTEQYTISLSDSQTLYNNKQMSRASYFGSVDANLKYVDTEEPPAETPEPLTFFLAGGALLGIGFVTRRVRR